VVGHGTRQHRAGSRVANPARGTVHLREAQGRGLFFGDARARRVPGELRGFALARSEKPRRVS